MAIDLKTEPKPATDGPATGPRIIETPGVCGGRSRIDGTRIRVQDIYIWHELQGRTVDQIVAAFPQLSHAAVHAALAYFFSHADGIRRQMDADDQLVDQMKHLLGPGPLQSKISSRADDAADHSLSPR